MGEEAEVRILREFYRSTVGRAWVRLSDFDGVTVGRGGRTEQIQLRDNGLKTNSGSIDWGMLNGLQCLTVLDLSSNALTGEIAKAMPYQQTISSTFCALIAARLLRPEFVAVQGKYR